jgi:hypothetical protein
LGFVEAKSDTLLFIFWSGSDILYLLLYVDDIFLTTSSTMLLQHTISALKQKFTMRDLGSLHHFLRVSVQQRPNELFLSQHQYALDILERASMVECKPVSTPMDM